MSHRDRLTSRDLRRIFPGDSEAKHPRALGRPGREAWGEVWDTIGPMLAGVMTTARATWSVDTELYYDRKLRLEEVYVTWTFAPILARDGQTVDGVFCPCYETTRQVVSPRRLETLRKLGIKAGEARTVAEACQQTDWRVTSGGAGRLRPGGRSTPGGGGAAGSRLAGEVRGGQRGERATGAGT